MDTDRDADQRKAMWPINRPDRLETIALRYLARNLYIIAKQGKPRLPAINDLMDCSSEVGNKEGEDLVTCVESEITTCHHLHHGVCLPESICDRLLYFLSEDAKQMKGMTYEKLSIFSDSKVAKLSRADLRSVADHSLEMGLKMISQQPIKELKMPCIWRCFPFIKRLEKLRVLRLDKEPESNAVDAFIQPSAETQAESIQSAGTCVEQGFTSSSSSAEMDAYKLNCPNLRCLTLNNLQFRAPPHRDPVFNSLTVSSLLSSVPHLSYLSLSMCRVKQEELTCIGSLTNLHHLNLSNIKINDFEVLERTLRPLKKLLHLDVSHGDDEMNPVIYQGSSSWLRRIMSCLPTLVSLDISGTNLAGFEASKPVSHRMGPSSTAPEPEEELCSIPGLENRHLEFLGLFSCAYNACKRKHIPATRVTGDADSHQVVLAVNRYVDNHFLLNKALNDLFGLFRFTSVHNHRQALEGVLSAMRIYPADASIQIAGSASLFYIAKGDHKQFITHEHKRDLVNLLLAGMHEHCFDQTMMRNASLTLCHLNLPCDVMFCYERLVKQLLDMLRYDYRDEFIHRLGIFLLNCLACQVDGREKELVGKLGAIETMLQIISRKVRAGECDDMLEVSWSTLWNVTDETPSNCQKFLTKGGMQLFVACLQKFKDKPELLRNMMGLMGNIAEVDSLRANLMTEEYVEIFSDLLQSESDGIEVSYNACGVLAHLCYDGPQAWTLKKPSRRSVINRMKRAIGRWPLSSKRNINYRSFEPILRLINHYETPIVQYWACWALCNLTSVSPEKYCRLLEAGKGRQVLEQVVENPETQEHIRRLLQRTLKRMNHARSLGYNLEGADVEALANRQEDNMAVVVSDDEDDNDDDDNQLQEDGEVVEMEEMGECVGEVVVVGDVEDDDYVSVAEQEVEDDDGDDDDDNDDDDEMREEEEEEQEEEVVSEEEEGRREGAADMEVWECVEV